MATIFDNQWRTLSKRKIEDVRQEVLDALVRFHGTPSATTGFNASGDEVRLVHIGTDAQKHGRNTDFVTAVGVLNPGHGAIAWYAKSRMEHVHSLQHKLFTEVGFSIELALALCEFGIQAEAIDVHVDANTNLKWESGPFHQRLAGMVMAHGFRAVLKPDAWCASHLADHAVNGKNDAKIGRRRRKRALRKEYRAEKRKRKAG